MRLRVYIPFGQIGPDLVNQQTGGSGPVNTVENSTFDGGGGRASMAAGVVKA